MKVLSLLLFAFMCLGCVGCTATFHSTDPHNPQANTNDYQNELDRYNQAIRLSPLEAV
jgi:hypothetical protein